MAESLNSLPENGSNGSNGVPSPFNGAAVPAKPPASPPAASSPGSAFGSSSGSPSGSSSGSPSGTPSGTPSGSPLRLRFKRQRPQARSATAPTHAAMLTSSVGAMRYRQRSSPITILSRSSRPRMNGYAHVPASRNAMSPRIPRRQLPRWLWWRRAGPLKSPMCPPTKSI